jgi:hypothetical protein
LAATAELAASSAAFSFIFLISAFDKGRFFSSFFSSFFFSSVRVDDYKRKERETMKKNEETQAKTRHFGTKGCW